jgi:hypothetical protein
VLTKKQRSQFTTVRHHLGDLLGLLRFRLANPRPYSKFRMIRSIARQTGARMLIETGTFRGITAERCSKVFERVFTIELDKDLAAKAATFLQPRRNVEVIQGDGLVELPRLLERAEVNDALIFLDGHYSGGITAQSDLPEPAVEELRILASFKPKIRAILIDDFRCFGQLPGFPKKSELLQAYETHFADQFAATIHLDQMVIAPRYSRVIPA